MKLISLIVLAAEPAKASTASPKSAGTQQSQIAAKFDYDGGEREFAYDRKSHVGWLGRGLDEAGARGCMVVSMQDDWKTIFAPAPRAPCLCDATSVSGNPVGSDHRLEQLGQHVADRPDKSLPVIGLAHRVAQQCLRIAYPLI